MKIMYRFLGFLLCILPFSILISQTNEVSQADLSKDMKTIQKAMETYHPNAYYYHSKEEVEAFQNQLEEETPTQMSRANAYRYLNQFVNYFNDAHTRINAQSINKEYNKAGGVYIPLAVEVQGESLVIRKVLSEKVSSALIGQSIQSINGIPAKELLNEMELHANRETVELDRAVISRDFPYYLWLAYAWNGPFALELENGFTQTIAGIDHKDLYPAKSKKQKELVHYEVIDGAIAYLRILDFQSLSVKGFRKKFVSAFAYFRAQGATDHLILDIRNHNGGDARVGKALGRYIASSSFKPFAYSYWKATPTFKSVFKKTYLPGAIRWALPVIKGLNPHTKAIYNAEDDVNAKVEYKTVKPFSDKKRFTGQVYLLMDHHTFSAGTCFAAMVKDYQMATIIGQASGNTANFHADALLRLKLPSIGVSMQISNSYLVRPSGDESHQSVQPDIKLPSQTNALDYTLDLIQKRDNMEGGQQLNAKPQVLKK